MKDVPMTYRPRPARTALTLSLGLALCACAVGPNYVRPTAPISPTYKELAGWTPAAPADALERGDWWALFGDETLNGLEAKVEVSNQNVAFAEAAYRQARALVREQRSAFFPTIDLDGSGQRAGGGRGSASTGTGTSTGTSGGSRGNSYRVDIGASWEIDVWGRIRRTVEAAKAQAQASAADLAAAKLSAQGELAADYFALRETDAQMALDQATVTGYRRSLQIAQNQYGAGIAPKSDVLQAQTQVSNAEADLAGLEQQRDVYEHAIAVLIGEAPGNFSLARAEWTDKVPDVPPGLPSTLLQRRPDIAAAERRMAAANAQIGVARAAYFPALTLTGSYGFAATEIGHLFDASGSIWSYGLAAAETLFDAGARGARVAESKAAYDQTVAAYRQAVLTALQDVEDQLAATRVLTRQYEFRRQASVAADQAEQMVLNRYQAGQVSFVDVVTAQAAAASARSAFVQAAGQRQATAVALIQSLGGGWSEAPKTKP
jgi:NodT family efflux transporter outer membrane factor (OMF) lipoprotein